MFYCPTTQRSSTITAGQEHEEKRLEKNAIDASRNVFLNICYLCKKQQGTVTLSQLW